MLALGVVADQSGRDDDLRQESVGNREASNRLGRIFPGGSGVGSPVWTSMPDLPPGFGHAGVGAVGGVCWSTFSRQLSLAIGGSSTKLPSAAIVAVYPLPIGMAVEGMPSV